MTETPFALPTADGKKIFGAVNSSEKASDTLLIFVHGLGASGNRHIFYNAARYFPQRGIDVCRFELYPGGPEGRFQMQCTMKTHADDLNSVITHFRPKYQKIIVAGHSLGVPTVLQGDLSQMDALILISGAAREFMDHPTMKLIEPLPGTPYMKTNYGVTSILSQEMFDSMVAIRPTPEVTQKITQPLLVVYGDKDYLAPYSPLYFQNAPTKQKLMKVIHGAGHTFDEAETSTALYKAIEEFVETCVK